LSKDLSLQYRGEQKKKLRVFKKLKLSIVFEDKLEAYPTDKDRLEAYPTDFIFMDTLNNLF